MRSADKKLFDAIHQGTIEDIRAALDAGADVNARDHLKRTALHWADSVEVAAVLLERGADAMAKDKFRYTPVEYARQEKARELISFLEDAYEMQRSHRGRVAEKKQRKGDNRAR
jgi:ankyrin repeat protein